MAEESESLKDEMNQALRADRERAQARASTTEQQTPADPKPASLRDRLRRLLP